MTAAGSKAGTHFNVLFFDEALTNLDVALKLQSYALFQSLLAKHETILVIEHNSELANCFETKYNVSMIGEHSVIEEN
jgi:ABC-type Mn2+/Zn2+ transport system ATPase subunit